MTPSPMHFVGMRGQIKLEFTTTCLWGPLKAVSACSEGHSLFRIPNQGTCCGEFLQPGACVTV